MHNTKEQIVNKNNTTSAITLLIRQLNDRLRMKHVGGRIMLTSGIQTLDRAHITNIMNSIAQFSDFNDRNDPYGEHDCATMEVDSASILWKIDYYDETLTQHSPDASDENITVRILTVMLVDEY